MDPLLWKIGLACVIIAIIGGGAELLGVKFPVINSTKRQALLALLGLILICVYGVGQWRGSAPFEGTWSGTLYDTSIDNAGRRSLGNITVDMTVSKNGHVEMYEHPPQAHPSTADGTFRNGKLYCNMFFAERNADREMRLSVEGAKLRVWVGRKLADGQGPESVYDNTIPN